MTEALESRTATMRKRRSILSVRGAQSGVKFELAMLIIVRTGSAVQLYGLGISIHLFMD